MGIVEVKFGKVFSVDREVVFGEFMTSIRGKIFNDGIIIDVRGREVDLFIGLCVNV